MKVPRWVVTLSFTIASLRGVSDAIIYADRSAPLALFLLVGSICGLWLTVLVWTEGVE